MQVTRITLSILAHHLTLERKRQGLSRAQAAAVCNVSPSFIRDAESEPARCSLGLLLQYMAGLGLSMDVTGWSYPPEAQAASRLPGDSVHEESRS
jgi:HTH-type transcriptional regulator/antitoxin HipB